MGGSEENGQALKHEGVVGAYNRGEERARMLRHHWLLGLPRQY
jgi:hypothetical protein